jgi:chromate reductase
MKLLAIPGSLRRDSYNRRLLLAAGEELGGGVDFELFEGLKAVPPYDEDDEHEPAPAAVARLRAAIAGADALLIATPEYNSSIPGQLKNALDWASRPVASGVLRDKPVAVIGASTGAFGAVWSQAELRKVLAASGARVLDAELALGHAAEHFDGHGRLADPQLRAQLQEVVELLVASRSWTRRTTVAPSATAVAQRFTDPARTSPAA